MSLAPITRAASTYRFSRAARTEPRVKRAYVGIDEMPTRDHQAGQAGSQHGHDAQRQQNARERQHDVYDTHEQDVYPAAVVARQEAHRDAWYQGDGDGDWPNGQRDT